MRMRKELAMHWELIVGASQSSGSRFRAPDSTKHIGPDSEQAYQQAIKAKAPTLHAQPGICRAEVELVYQNLAPVTNA